MKKLSFIAFFFLLFVNVILLSQAAEISISTDNPEMGFNQEFLIDVMVDPQGKDINAVQGGILFPVNLLEFKEARDGDSVITLWVESPHLLLPSQEGAAFGEIVFSGITPGGFQGLLSPYYEGGRSGKLFSLVFKAREPGSDLIRANQIKILLNDGEGSPVPVSAKNILINVRNIEVSSTIPAITDINPPEAFQPEVVKDSNVLDGKWFLVFSTVDKGSGIDHYEVSEKKSTPVTNYDNLNWEKVESPYLLSDQALQSYIYVKAVDKIGNMRVQMIPPRYPQVPTRSLWLLSILMLITLVSISYGISKVLRKKK